MSFPCADIEIEIPADPESVIFSGPRGNCVWIDKNLNICASRLRNPIVIPLRWQKITACVKVQANKHFGGYTIVYIVDPRDKYCYTMEITNVACKAEAREVAEVIGNAIAKHVGETKRDDDLPNLEEVEDTEESDESDDGLPDLEEVEDTEESGAKT